MTIEDIRAEQERARQAQSDFAANMQRRLDEADRENAEREQEKSDVQAGFRQILEQLRRNNAA